MANLVQSDVWLQYVLNNFIGSNLVGLHLHLFSNNATLDHSTTLGDLTECAFAGYSIQNLGTFGAATWNGSKWVIAAPLLTFTDSGPGPDNVYGYYVTDTANSVLYFAQLAPSPPIVMGTSLPLIGLIPQFAYTDIP